MTKPRHTPRHPDPSYSDYSSSENDEDYSSDESEESRYRPSRITFVPRHPGLKDGSTSNTLILAGLAVSGLGVLGVGVACLVGVFGAVGGAIIVPVFVIAGIILFLTFVAGSSGKHNLSQKDTYSERSSNKDKGHQRSNSKATYREHGQRREREGAGTEKRDRDRHRL